MKINYINCQFSAFSFLFLFFINSGFVLASDDNGVFDRSEEISEYISVFNSNNRIKILEVCKKLPGSGLNDKRLFDVINDKIVKSHHKLDKEYLSWLIKALASSGIEEYSETLLNLQKKSSVRIIRNHAKYQREKLIWYRKYNALMQSKKNHKAGEDPYSSMRINVLVDGELTMKKYIAERVFADKNANNNIGRDARVFRAIELQLKDNYKKARLRSYVQLISWYCKALGSSGDKQYIPVLEEVIKANINSKVTMHAARSLKMLEES